MDERYGTKVTAMRVNGDFDKMSLIEFCRTIPRGCHWSEDSLSQKTKEDVYFAVQHELDLFDEDDDNNTLSKSAAKFVRLWLRATRGAA